MDLLAVKRTRLRTCIWVCGLAMAVAWGIRGQYGHERGVMIPGVLGALAVVLVTPDARKRSRMPALGIAGGLGMAIGGVLSYGSIAGSGAIWANSSAAEYRATRVPQAEMLEAGILGLQAERNPHARTKLHASRSGAM